MPDVHQPDEEDREHAEQADDGESGLPDLGPNVEAQRDERPSSRKDPNAPDRPRT